MKQRLLILDDSPVATLPPAEVAATAEVQKEIANLPEAVRRIFVLCYRDYTGDMAYGIKPMPQWDGGEDQFGRRHHPIWPRIAEKILALGADPISYIKAQFGQTPGRRAPRPSQLLSDTAVAAWRSFAYTSTSELAKRREREDLAVRRAMYPLIDGARWDEVRALAYVLQEPMSEVAASALYRYCAASRYGLKEIADKFFVRAALQFCLQRNDYEAAWGDLIDARLRAVADELHRSGITV